MRTYLGLAATALLAACMNSAPITTQSWRVEWIHERPLMDRSYLSLSFDQQQARGMAGCNNWFANYQLTADQIRFQAPASTRKSCAPALMEQETRFLQALSEVERYRINPQGQLELLNAQGKAIILSPERP